MTPTSEVPTLAGVAGVEGARRARTWRRVGIVALALVVAVACLGWLGPREATASDPAGFTVTYPQVTRSGADSAVTIEGEDLVGGAPVVVEVPQALFDRLGLESIVPAPTTEAATADTVRLTFEAPRSDAFAAELAEPDPADRAAELAGRLSTRSDLGPFTYEIRLTTEGAAPRTVSVRTWVLP